MSHSPRPSSSARAALSAVTAATLVALTVAACGRKPAPDDTASVPSSAAPPSSAPGGTPADSAGRASAVPSPVPPAARGSGGASAAVDSTRRAPRDSQKAPHGPPQTASGAHAAAGGAITVAEVIGPSVRVGQEVRVTGRCVGYSQRSTLGAPPVSRSDWLLEGDGATIFVNGSLPQGCTVTEGSTGSTTIRARVAEDTLRALGGRPPARRRYLVRIGS